MKNKRILTTAAIIVALATLTAFGIFRNVPRTQAQDQLPPRVGDRVSFGMVGIAAGQTLRVSVSNIIMPNDVGFPPGPTRAVITFRNANGNLIRNRSGEVIRRAVDLERGETTFLDLNYDEFPPGPTRLQSRAVIVVTPPPIGDSTEQPPPVNDRIVSTVEVINNRDGRTQFAVFTNPAVIHGFNPQPDPPLGQ
ncbi:MAG TPA: hypothetical protein VGC97_20040 [Pyrinomonadaceae bacterium]|jgi:hypothetical protein